MVGGWLALLAATRHIDLEQRRAAQGWLDTAASLAQQTGHDEIHACRYETEAWRLLTDGELPPRDEAIPDRAEDRPERHICGDSGHCPGRPQRHRNQRIAQVANCVMLTSRCAARPEARRPLRLALPADPGLFQGVVIHGRQ